MSLIAAPYWLLAGGLLTLFIGHFMAADCELNSPMFDDHKSDAEIAGQLKKQHRRNPIAGFFIVVGYLAIFVSVAWRMIRKFN